jgi:hypothetical protein
VQTVAKKRKDVEVVSSTDSGYDGLMNDVAALLEQSRTAVVRTTNNILAATY